MNAIHFTSQVAMAHERIRRQSETRDAIEIFGVWLTGLQLADNMQQQIVNIARRIGIYAVIASMFAIIAMCCVDRFFQFETFIRILDTKTTRIEEPPRSSGSDVNMLLSALPPLDVIATFTAAPFVIQNNYSDVQLEFYDDESHRTALSVNSEQQSQAVQVMQNISSAIAIPSRVRLPVPSADFTLSSIIRNALARMTPRNTSKNYLALLVAELPIVQSSITTCDKGENYKNKSVPAFVFEHEHQVIVQMPDEVNDEVLEQVADKKYDYSHAEHNSRSRIWGVRSYLGLLVSAPIILTLARLRSQLLQQSSQTDGGGSSSAVRHGQARDAYNSGENNN